MAGTGIFGAGSIYCIKTGNEDYYKHVLMPLVRKLPGEDSHRLAVLGFKLKLFNGTPTADPDNLVRDLITCLSCIRSSYTFLSYSI